LLGVIIRIAGAVGAGGRSERLLGSVSLRLDIAIAECDWRDGAAPSIASKAAHAG
jgi:hypothetical protein